MRTAKHAAHDVFISLFYVTAFTAAFGTWQFLAGNVAFFTDLFCFFYTNVLLLIRTSGLAALLSLDLPSSEELRRIVISYTKWHVLFVTGAAVIFFILSLFSRRRA